MENSVGAFIGRALGIFIIGMWVSIIKSCWRRPILTVLSNVGIGLLVTIGIIVGILFIFG